MGKKTGFWAFVAKGSFASLRTLQRIIEIGSERQYWMQKTKDKFFQALLKAASRGFWKISADEGFWKYVF
jgi:hypothetical protein